MQKLSLISTGPGHIRLMAPAARDSLEACSDIVAYGMYLQLLGDITQGKTLHELPLGQEVARAELALNLAAAGRHVALISSGDIGIYAMATVVFERIDLAGHAHWSDITIEVIPGISAMQLNAALAGALLGHDFCTISLSDLLTSWATIEKRLHAAGAGDFVVSFYNPLSKQRDWQFDAARDILLAYRSPQTPVATGRQLGRAGQSFGIMQLGELAADSIDMFTCITVGNSTSRMILHQGRRWAYTPRGYPDRHREVGQ